MLHSRTMFTVFGNRNFPMLNQNPHEIRGEANAYQDMKSVARAGERFANTERSEVSITFTVFVHRQLGSACCRMMEGGNELRTPFTHFYWDPRVTSEHDRSSANRPSYSSADWGVVNEFSCRDFFLFSTYAAWPNGMSHRKWRETKQ